MIALVVIGVLIASLYLLVFALCRAAGQSDVPCQRTGRDHRAALRAFGDEAEGLWSGEVPPVPRVVRRSGGGWVGR